MMTAHVFISMVYISPHYGVINHVLRMLSARSARLQDDLSKVVCHADPIIVFNIPLNSAYQAKNKENGPFL
jgi:hypothetical protein